jgi:hexosaminidase
MNILKFIFLTLLLAVASAKAANLPNQAVPNAVEVVAQPDPLPTPREIRYGEGFLSLDNLSIGVIGDPKQMPELAYAVRDLNDELKTRLGRTLTVVNTSSSNSIRLGTLKDPALAAAVTARKLDVNTPEGYALWVESDGAAVVGFDALGLYRGVQTLRQLLARPGFRLAQSRDWPAFGSRVAMIYLDQYSQQVNDKLIPLLAKYKYNQLLIMCNYVQWQSSKNIWHPGGASKAEAMRIAKLVRDYGMEPIPLIETPGHAQWLFYNNQNRDLVQDPESKDPYAYDTLNPRTYEVLLPILTEAVEVFRPKYLHIGHDEAAARDRFPARDNGKAIGFAQLFVDDTLKLYNHLKTLGVGTMIWHDVAFGDAFGAQIYPQLPKDIQVVYWNYIPAASYPLIASIRDLGFAVLGGSWFSANNPENFARSALPDRAVGMVQTRWSGYFGNLTIFDGQAEQGVAYLAAANAFWNPTSSNTGSSNTGSGNDLMQRYRDGYQANSFQNSSGKLIDLTPVATRALQDPDESQWLQKGPSLDLTALATGVQKLGPYRFNISKAAMTKGTRASVGDLPAEIKLEIGEKANSIAFLHTTGWVSTISREAVGSYLVEYSDNSSTTIALNYGQNIFAWTEQTLRSVLPEVVWKGKTGDGLDIALGVLLWPNPKPNLTIKSITLRSLGKQANPTLLGLTLLP